MEKMVTDLLEVYFTNNKKMPDAIVYYRDGVSDGQFEEVLRKEYAYIKDTVENFRGVMSAKGQTWDPKINVVVVQKRHHVRIFQANSKHQDKSGNAMPGRCLL
jgi:eukaryotic translation initiation factor 2C